MLCLVNPPGRRRYLRDYYCAGIAKSSYYYPPIDFVYLSARPGPTAVADCINRPGSEAGLPGCDEMILLTSVMSWREDRDFVRGLRQDGVTARIGLAGDLARTFGDGLLRAFPGADFVVPDFLEAMRAADPDLKSLPDYDALGFERYFFPFYRATPVAHMLTDHGCAFKCDFCPMSEVDHWEFPLDFVDRQLAELRRRGFTEVHVRDQTFGQHMDRCLELCDMLGHYGFTWSCITRADVMREPKLERMRAGGCHTVIIGVETASEDSRRAHRKGIRTSAIDDVLGRCRSLGIRSVGTFILGLPDEGPGDWRRTIDYARSLPLDYASFNRAQYRLGTGMCRNGRPASLDDLESFQVWCNPDEDIERVVAAANRRFYLRPGRMLRLAGDMLRKGGLGSQLAVAARLFAGGRSRTGG